MLAAVARCPITFDWEDRDGNKAAQRLWFNSTDALATIEAGASVWIEACRPLSSASLRSYTVTWQWLDESESYAEIGSDVLRRLVLYYRNESQHAAIWVPSGRLELLEIVGNYRGVRVDMSNPLVVPVVGAVDDLVSFICTRLVAPFPNEYLVGGVAL